MADPLVLPVLSAPTANKSNVTNVFLERTTILRTRTVNECNAVLECTTILRTQTENKNNLTYVVLERATILSKDSRQQTILRAHDG